MTCTTPWTSPRKLSALLGVALPLLTASITTVHAQETASETTTTTTVETVTTVTPATVTPGSAITVRPGRSSYVTPDLRTAVIGATETQGNTNLARRGLAAASAAISVLPGYTSIAPGEVARAMSGFKRDELRVPEYKALKKSLRADRVLSVILLPGTVGDDSASYTAIAELYDTTTGGLVGRGESTYTATSADAPLTSADATTPPANVARGPLVEGTTGTVAERSIDGAIARAVFALNNPIVQTGVVLNKMGNSNTKGAPLMARISLGERDGLRNGAPIEYVANGQRIGFGTIVDLGSGESLATVAPEAAFSRIYINTEVRNLDNPPVSRAGASGRTLDNREFARFEREFGIAFIGAFAAYYLIAR